VAAELEHAKYHALVFGVKIALEQGQTFQRRVQTRTVVAGGLDNGQRAALHAGRAFNGAMLAAMMKLDAKDLGQLCGSPVMEIPAAPGKQRPGLSAATAAARGAEAEA